MLLFGRKTDIYNRLDIYKRWLELPEHFLFTYNEKTRKVRTIKGRDYDKVVKDFNLWILKGEIPYDYRNCHEIQERLDKRNNIPKRSQCDFGLMPVNDSVCSLDTNVKIKLESDNLNEVGGRKNRGNIQSSIVSIKKKKKKGN